MQIALDQHKTCRDDRRVIDRADERQNIWNEIKRIENIDQRERRGSNSPIQGAAINTAAIILKQSNQHFAILDEALQWTPGTELFLDLFRMVDNLLNILIGYFFSPCLYKLFLRCFGHLMKLLL